MIFQNSLRKIDSQIEELNQKRQWLLECDQQAKGTLKALEDLIGSVEDQPDAIASLKSETMALFGGEDVLLRGQADELCSPLACCIEDAPLDGQVCQLSDRPFHSSEQIFLNDVSPRPPAPPICSWEMGDQVVWTLTPSDTWELVETPVGESTTVRAVNLRTAQVDSLPLADCQLVLKLSREREYHESGNSRFELGQYCQVMHSERHPESQGKIGVLELISAQEPQFPLTVSIDGELHYFQPEELMVVANSEVEKMYAGGEGNGELGFF
ncbi:MULTISPECIES: hypothetical protein [unclassified Coleofasciculus]|uniref:hypothetical protein n=1 Tax=unclassified Coleofasciculus TaxID=2692782 RepID=UPI00187EAAE7|nr:MULTISPECIES: hypothetical protein [unclassified Coleofasciculus]MBE9124716.1 hypothetical protein [Coleofasciculus sp. LEGE 07081]MBE9151841.1 hypothetical protein [Coleofasciculus sp. LEGE 07092]